MQHFGAFFSTAVAFIGLEHSGCVEKAATPGCREAPDAAAGLLRSPFFFLSFCLSHILNYTFSVAPCTYSAAGSMSTPWKVGAMGHQMVPWFVVLPDNSSVADLTRCVSCAVITHERE